MSQATSKKTLLQLLIQAADRGDFEWDKRAKYYAQDNGVGYSCYGYGREPDKHIANDNFWDMSGLAGADSLDMTELAADWNTHPVSHDEFAAASDMPKGTTHIGKLGHHWLCEGGTWRVYKQGCGWVLETPKADNYLAGIGGNDDYDPMQAFDDERVDAIGQNGNDGEHYGYKPIAVTVKLTGGSFESEATKQTLADHMKGLDLQTHDDIKHPSHYQFFEDLEVIEIIASTMTQEQFYGYCLGNKLKYSLRAGKKGHAEQCLGKAKEYDHLYNKHVHLCKES